MTDFEILPAARHTRMRWANGAGWTIEIIAEPSSSRWDWRLSVADVEVAGPFSVLPGIDRSIALLRGAGFALTVGEGDEHVVDQPFHPFDFTGDDVTACRLIDGPVQDINLMTTRSSVARRLEFAHVAQPSTIEWSNADVLVVVAGGVTIDGRDLGYLDAIRCTSPSPIVLTSTRDGTVVASVSALSHG